MDLFCCRSKISPGCGGVKLGSLYSAMVMDSQVWLFAMRFCDVCSECSLVSLACVFTLGLSVPKLIYTHIPIIVVTVHDFNP